MEGSTHLPLSCRSAAVRGFLATAGDTGIFSWSSSPAPLCLKSSSNFSSSNGKTEDRIWRRANKKDKLIENDINLETEEQDWDEDLYKQHG